MGVSCGFRFGTRGEVMARMLPGPGRLKASVSAIGSFTVQIPKSMTTDLQAKSLGDASPIAG